MPKRRRLFTPLKNKSKPFGAKSDNDNKDSRSAADNEVRNARGRLKGALMEVLEPAEESDNSFDPSPSKRRKSYEQRDMSDDEDSCTQKSHSQLRQSYVLKLFDRSVDLSQFKEDSPLYPICRAWITNQPKAIYREFGKSKFPVGDTLKDHVVLPGPEGEPVSRVPGLLKEQLDANKNNINLNYREAPPPSREHLLHAHLARWTAVRHAWIDQSNKVEARYEATQQVLNKINVEFLASTR